ncbi:MAG: hypothetical protein ABL958_11030 [Bdellovibrionia bacterium]
MTVTKRIFQLAALLFVFPLTAILVGTAYAKSKPLTTEQPAKAKVVQECMHTVSQEAGPETLALNEVCTCLVDKMPVQTQAFAKFLGGVKGRKEFGRCLFLAKDGL